jgi:hypothetical protein
MHIDIPYHRFSGKDIDSLVGSLMVFIKTGKGSGLSPITDLNLLSDLLGKTSRVFINSPAV